MKDQALPPPSDDALRRGYEADTVSMRALAWFGGIFVAFALVSQVLLWFLLIAYIHRDREADRSLSAITAAPQLPPVPIQPRPGHDRLPAQDMQALLTQEDDLFARMGWNVDRTTHRVAIPDAVVRAVADRPPSTQPATRPMAVGGVR